MDNVLQGALELRQRGFAIHWLRPHDKAPIRAGWANETARTAQQLMQEYKPGLNVGFRAGKWSVVDDREICVLDVDIAGGPQYAAEAHAAAAQIMEGMPCTVISGSGVGRHYYLAFPIGTSPDCAATTLRQSDIWVHKETKAVVPPQSENSKPAWVIELLSTGKNVVMPPSIHPITGETYKWI